MYLGPARCATTIQQLLVVSKIDFGRIYCVLTIWECYALLTKPLERIFDLRPIRPAPFHSPLKSLVQDQATEEALFLVPCQNLRASFNLARHYHVYDADRKKRFKLAYSGERNWLRICDCWFFRPSSRQASQAFDMLICRVVPRTAWGLLDTRNHDAFHIPPHKTPTDAVLLLRYH